ncbi:hypothetical protein GCM10023206_07230 [Acinetobacter puyangensis]|uniref:DUF1376 domain-containing protein n=1 Tax=Acinetobacter puyangensis TaxID=1096779 RepID=A0A240E617_9GAMM|nr:DUF1376 domain-containing protein [Acinetobacter puyangensis]SNX44197.1 Protein of unknown function [Acinetobacter puyangensis]
MSNLIGPLTPKECDVSNFPFMPLDIDRLLNSETWILGDDSEKVASMTLWLKSWHQIPAASIPNNDKMLAHLSGMGTKWKKVKEHALRGWVDGGDGRLYHPVVAEKALEAWIEKLASAISGAQGNAKRWQIEINTSDLQNQLCDAVYRLKNIAPQSKALTKKIAKIIESQSQPVSGGDSNPNQVGIATDKTQNRIDNSSSGSNAGEENFTPQQDVIAGYAVYQMQDHGLYSLMELEQKYPALQQNFIDQAKASYKSHTLNMNQYLELFTELRKWSLTKSIGQTPQKWINSWLTIVKNNAHEFDKSTEKPSHFKNSRQPEKPKHKYGTGVVTSAPDQNQMRDVSEVDHE